MASGNSQSKGSAPEFLAIRSGLSDVTDRSHHRSERFGAKSFMAWNVLAGFRLKCRFLGGNGPRLRWWAPGSHLPCLWPRYSDGSSCYLSGSSQSSHREPGAKQSGGGGS
jgi:hypothetical protein